MPASSKSQQRFFGVVKAMQKGDIPKKGKAGKIAKQMTKKDVDDFASTKHKGKPEKVKREMKVRNLIKKMVREELAKMNEEKLTEDFKNNKWEVYVADEKGREKIVKVAKSKRAGVILYNKLINTDKFHEVGMRVIKEGKLTEANKSLPPFEIAKRMMKSKYWNKAGKGFSEKVIKKFRGRGVTPKSLDKWLPDYIDGKEISKLFEGKLTESGAQIAKTILKQLGGNKFIAMTGAKNLGHTNKGLQMKIGRNSKGVTHVIIDLDRGKDLYDIEFVKVRGTKRTTVKKLKGIYADQLGEVFTRYTGLRIRL